MPIILYTKKYTETLKEMLQRFRNENADYHDSKITYAGRLDPMAEGLMILLTDNDVHKKQDFLGYDKIYEVEFFFGPLTDTLDILGIIQDESKPSTTISCEKIKKEIIGLKDISQQQYPAYSSKTVDGKPLWLHAREGSIDTIEIPKRDIQIYSAEFLKVNNITAVDLWKHIYYSISNVEGDFRQESIIARWKKYAMANKEKEITVYSMRLHVSSGTYIRGIVSKLGQRIGLPTTSIKIKRISIGDNLLT
jgi:tRNA pseudouridine(55) synthase